MRHIRNKWYFTTDHQILGQMPLPDAPEKDTHTLIEYPIFSDSMIPFNILLYILDHTCKHIFFTLINYFLQLRLLAMRQGA